MMASGWKEINNNLYYFQSWGGIYKNGFQSIGGNEYYFRSWGGEGHADEIFDEAENRLHKRCRPRRPAGCGH